MELRQYARLVLKWWWMLLLGTVFAGATGYYVSVSQLPIYRSSATLLVNQAQSSQGIDYNSLLTSERLTRTYAELFRKTPVLAATIAKLNLPYSPGQLAKLIQVRVIANTQLLEVSVEHQNREQARDIANTLAEQFIAQRLEEQLGQTNASREILRQQISDLEKELKVTAQSLEAAKAASAQSVEADRLQTVLSQAQITYAQLLKNEQDMRLAEARTLGSVKLADPAGTPGAPVRPQVSQNAMLAALVGLLLALGVAFLVEYLDDTVKMADDVQRAVQLATLGVVGRIPSTKGDAGQPRLLQDNAARSPLGESYRILRVNIDFAWAGREGKTLMLTSSNPREGKTTTISNLALVLAKDNRRVLIIDADLRRPSVHRSFGLEATRGLSNVLADHSARVGDFVVPTKVANLSVLPSGPIPPNPSELLGSPRFAAILDELKSLADIVLIDTPPLLAVADPAVIAPRVDGVIMIAEAGGARVQALIRAHEVLARSSANVLGVVLNKLSRSSDGYYYHYYHRYYGVKPSSSNGAKQQQEAKV